MNPDPLAWLTNRAGQREAAGLRRRLHPRPPGADGLLDLASNDYLGLARHPEVVAAAADAVRVWGAGSTGSRLVTGSTELHAELEAALAEHLAVEAGLVFSSGYLANIGALAALAGPGDLVVSDARNHASIVDACRLTRARVVVADHRDVAVVEAALAGRDEDRAYVVTESIYSVDGDLAPLEALAEAARRHDAALVVDEAHSMGVVGTGGRGALHAAGLAGASDVVVTATLSKGLGSQGGAVMGSRALIEHTLDSARTFIFDTALAPSCAAAALASLRVLQREPWRADAVRANALELSDTARGCGLDSPVPDGAIVSVMIGAPSLAVAAASACADIGVRVGCFRPPSVPDGVSRLRLTARPDLDDAARSLARKALEAVADLVRGSN